MLGAQTQEWWPTGLVAPGLVIPSRTRDRTCIPCIGRWILNQWPTQEALPPKILPSFSTICYLSEGAFWYMAPVLTLELGPPGSWRQSPPSPAFSCQQLQTAGSAAPRSEGADPLPGTLCCLGSPSGDVLGGAGWTIGKSKGQPMAGPLAPKLLPRNEGEPTGGQGDRLAPPGLTETHAGLVACSSHPSEGTNRRTHF